MTIFESWRMAYLLTRWRCWIITLRRTFFPVNHLTTSTYTFYFESTFKISCLLLLKIHQNFYFYLSTQAEYFAQHW